LVRASASRREGSTPRGAAAYRDQADTMIDEVAEFMDVQPWPSS
jgi:hypothetical protein